ncbi:MAG TPA: isoprenylcysteine carboxylmethyltransferase family protein [Gemmatimonadaceae bacterium]|jgi:protein-S-isoprenylcysteine O-methyltransferase Ste14|nr:isoprenylcysteine carboxylmethyltransferase family protein [Gemmatimonadaceae bacterium]
MLRSLVVRAALFLLIVPGTIAGWLPWYISGWRRPRLDDALGIVGLAVAVFGWLVLLWCARDFAVRGSGTPNPADPPRALVVDGLYRFVRNPMYVAIVISLLGQAAMYRSSDVLWYAVIVAVAFHLRVVMYEEPKLNELFGGDYSEYRGRVPRWVPVVALPRRRR